MAVTKPTSDIENTEQTIQNSSFDKEFGVNVVELLGHESVGNTLNRVLVDTDGKVYINIEGLATSTNQTSLITEVQKLIGFEIEAYDYIALTYVAAGNGAGEIETVVYKTGGSGGTTVATLTLVYNESNEISSVTKT